MSLASKMESHPGDHRALIMAINLPISVTSCSPRFRHV